MWEDIKEILLDFLKGFRWYVFFIPVLIVLGIGCRYNSGFALFPILILICIVLFCPFILALGTILSFIFNTNERECRKHKRKKIERQERKENRKQ